MVWRDFRLVERVGFHPHKLLNVLKLDLDKTVIAGDIGELGIEELAHEWACGTHVVDLLMEISTMATCTEAMDQKRCLPSSNS